MSLDSLKKTLKPGRSPFSGFKDLLYFSVCQECIGCISVWLEGSHCGKLTLYSTGAIDSSRDT